jgi:hypothetical protein
MKTIQFIGLIVCAAFFASCETTNTAGNTNGMGNQEAKRLAALREEQQQPQPDESHKNLWNAEHDVLTRDGKAIIDY